LYAKFVEVVAGDVEQEAKDQIRIFK